MSDDSHRPPSLLKLPSYLASQAARYGSRHLETALERHGLALGHHAILTALDDFGPLSQRELAERLSVDKSHMVGRLDRLESARLVMRAADPDDRRRHQVLLTGHGHALLDELRIIAQESQQKFLQMLTDAERATLEALLRRVLNDHDRATRSGRAAKEG